MCNSNYKYFRKVWDRPAALHLARLHDRKDCSWAKRFSSAIWLLSERVPLDGAVSLLKFKGMKSNV